MSAHVPIPRGECRRPDRTPPTAVYVITYINRIAPPCLIEALKRGKLVTE